MERHPIRAFFFDRLSRWTDTSREAQQAGHNEIRAGNSGRVALLAMKEAHAAEGKGPPLSASEAAELKEARLGMKEQVHNLLKRDREKTITVPEQEQLQQLTARAAEVAEKAKQGPLVGADRAEYDALQPLMPKARAWGTKEPAASWHTP